MCKCHEFAFNCRQGRDCPSQYDSEDHLIPDSSRSSVQMIGIVLALFVVVGIAVIVGTVSAVGRAAGWW